MLTKDNKMIKEENKKLKHDMNEKEILTPSANISI